MFGWRARIGQIRPGPAIEGAEEWRQAAPDGVAFVDARTPLDETSERGVEAMMTHVVEAARLVASAKADVIVQCGAPGVFVRGYGYDKVVIDHMQKATNVPSTTMMTAMVDALRAVGVTRLAVATIYSDDLNVKLQRYLEAAGFAVVAMKGLSIIDTSTILYMDAYHAYRLARDVFLSSDGADGILISCGGYRTFEIIDALERDMKVPVITSNQSALWQALRMARVSEEIPRLGRLFRVPS